MKPVKFYLIRITGNYANKNLWYADKKGREYEAKIVTYAGETPRFKVTDGMTVDQLDCIVISERIA